MTPQPGDILAIRGQGWLSDGIAKVEYPQGEPSISATHVGIFITSSVVIEALNRVVTRPLSRSLDGVQKAFCLYDKSLSESQRLAIITRALSFSANDYGYSDLIAQWLTARTGWRFWLKYWPFSKLICSYVVAESYEVIRLEFGVVGDEFVKPSDIISFALKHPEIYEIEVLKNGS